jgi:hypothetical protein
VRHPGRDSSGPALLDNPLDAIGDGLLQCDGAGATSALVPMGDRHDTQLLSRRGAQGVRKLDLRKLLAQRRTVTRWRHDGDKWSAHTPVIGGIAHNLEGWPDPPSGLGKAPLASGRRTS